jgi:hypothetical protein
LDGVLFELLAEGGAVADGFGHELAFEAAFVLKEVFAPAGVVEVDAAVFGVEAAGVEDLVAEAVEGEGFDEDGAKGFDEVEGKGPAAVFGGVKEAEGGVEAVGVEEGDGFGVEEGGAEGDAGVNGVEGRSGGAAGIKVAQVCK